MCGHVVAIDPLHAQVMLPDPSTAPYGARSINRHSRAQRRDRSGDGQAAGLLQALPVPSMVVAARVDRGARAGERRACRKRSHPSRGPTRGLAAHPLRRRAAALRSVVIALSVQFTASRLRRRPTGLRVGVPGRPWSARHRLVVPEDSQLGPIDAAALRAVAISAIAERPAAPAVLRRAGLTRRPAARRGRGGAVPRRGCRIAGSSSAAARCGWCRRRSWCTRRPRTGAAGACPVPPGAAPCRRR